VTQLLNKTQAAKISQTRRSKLFRYFPLSIIGFGILVRLSQYISNRSLWGDEASIALNIIHRSYLELLQPLDHNQAAPPGFLWVEKLSVQGLGNTEYAFRLFPLIAGIVSLFAFYKLAQWAVSPLALPIALILFACLEYSQYYATEAKPYSSDATIALLLAILLIRLRGQVLKRKTALMVGLAGTVSIWFSFPAIFTLVGLEAANLLTLPKAKWRAILTGRWLTYYIWAVSFGLIYLTVIAGAITNSTLQEAWNSAYPASLADFPWLLESFGQFFSHPLGFHGISEEVAISAFIVGCIAFWQQNRTKLLLLTAPILVTLIASYLHKYPFRTRLVFFLTPVVILIIAEGLAYLLSQFKTNKLKGKFIALIGFVMSCIVLLPPSVEAGSRIVEPRVKRAMRPVVEYTHKHHRPGDLIFVDTGSSPDQFKYYAERFGFRESDYLFGYREFLIADQFSEQRWKAFKAQSGKLHRGQRVWFVFSGLNQQEKLLVKPRLDQIGQELDHCDRPGALTYLYQLK
jgi:hypothetical protein